MLKHIAGILVVIVVLAACASQQAAAPTATATTEAPTEIPTEAQTQQPVQRSTLPPTWTEAPETTNTALPTAVPLPSTTPDASIPTAEVATYTPSCDTFGPDLNRLNRTFTPGEDVPVYWLPVPEAQFYQVSLLDDQGKVVFSDLTDQTGYVFRADLFKADRIYGWQAHPINALGQQFCQDRGSELVPSNFVEN